MLANPNSFDQVVPPQSTTRRLRVAVITETYPPEVNGVARTMQQFVSNLVERGHDITLMRPRQVHERSSAPSQHDTGFRLLLTSGLPIPRYAELRLGLASPGWFMQHWQRERPDIVHIVTEGPLGWSALVAARRMHLPMSSGFHTNFHAYSAHYGIGALTAAVGGMLRAFHNRCDATIVPTEQIRVQLSRDGFERLSVVGRGIDTGLFRPDRRSEALRASWGCSGDEPVVLYVGRLAPEKNLGLFTQAARAVQAVNKSAKVVVVGDGPLAASMKLANPTFLFAGTQLGESLAAHYASADLFLFPSTTETFGNVTTEALASGLVVVAFDEAAARQHIRDEVSGILVASGDAAAFASTAQSIACSPQCWRTLRKNAAAVGARLSWSAVVDDFERVLQSAVSRSSSRAMSGLSDPTLQAAGLVR